MVLLYELLATNAETISDVNALPGVLGDAYLYRFNPLFRNIRDACLAVGYRFTSADSELGKYYQAFSLVSLQWLLEAKQIPFIDNTAVLYRVLDLNPNLKIPQNLLFTSLRHNYLMHEGAHAVGNSIMAASEPPFLKRLPEAERFVLRALLTEAFANTVERLSSSEASSHYHALFYVLNSYIPYKQTEVRKIGELIGRFGLQALFRLGYCLYFFSNLFTRVLSKQELARVHNIVLADVLPDSDTTAALAAELIANGFYVNPVFRRDTNVMYFDLHARGENYAGLVDSQLLLEDEPLETLRDFANVFWTIVENGAAGITDAVTVGQPGRSGVCRNGV